MNTKPRLLTKSTQTELVEQPKTTTLAINSLVNEIKLRENLSRYFVVINFCMAFYILMLDQIKELNLYFGTHSYTTAALSILFASTVIYLIYRSDYKLSSFGITFQNWKAASLESFLFTLPILGVATIVKYILIHHTAHFAYLPLFDFDSIVLSKANEPAIEWQSVWWSTLILYVFIIAPFQEVIVRCGLQKALSFYLTGKYRVFISTIIASMLFSATHSAHSIYIVILSFFGGLFWGWLFTRQKTFIGAAVSHIMIGVWIFWFLGF